MTLVESMMRYTALMHTMQRDSRDLYTHALATPVAFHPLEHGERNLAVALCTQHLARAQLAQAVHADVSLSIRRSLGIED